MGRNPGANAGRAGEAAKGAFSAVEGVAKIQGHVGCHAAGEHNGQGGSCSGDCGGDGGYGGGGGGGGGGGLVVARASTGDVLLQGIANLCGGLVGFAPLV